MEANRRKIGILGGTFDPIHYGHLLIAENAAVQYSLDEVWFMPTGQSPHKVQEKISDTGFRCDMIQLAISDNSKFLLSRFEIENAETNYTYRTLQKISEQYPEDEFFFILGGDSLKSFETWRYPEEILKSAYILAAVRDDVEGNLFQEYISKLTKKYNTLGIFPLRTPNVSISSSDIRTSIQQGKSVRYMLPDNVITYIEKYGLYCNKK